MKPFLNWFRDRLWPMLEGEEPAYVEVPVEFATAPSSGVASVVYARLQEEMTAEADRRRAVEAKLVAVSSTATVAVTITAGVVTFLTSGRAGEFTDASVRVLAVASLYVALQFVHSAMSAAQGLARASYAGAVVQDLLSDGADQDSYFRSRCIELSQRLGQHRYANSQRVSQLALAHTSFLNATWGLVCMVGIVALIAAWR